MTKKRKYPSQTIPLDDRIQAWEDAGRMCHYCDRPVARPGTKSGKRTHLDHKISHSEGGDDHVDNLIVSCKMCNLEKGDKTYALFIHHRLVQAQKQVRRLTQLMEKLP